jgi:hypothetical protein
MEDNIMTLEEFVFNVPLYHEITLNNGYKDIIEQLRERSQRTTIDGYNSIQRKESTFYLAKGLGDYRAFHSGTDSSFMNYRDSLVREEGVKTLDFICQRYYNKITIAVFHNPQKSVIVKVGQYPSVADIHIGQVKQYDKVLEKPILKEFTKAIGLAANGVGIGSFVYLRRIFENLIYEVLEEAKDVIDIEVFKVQRMDEKIDTLKNYLPPFIVENKQIYGILSKGIHELEEEECLAYFDCMRQSIELILDERLVQLEKKKKEAEVKKALSSIAGKIKN